MVDTQYTFVQGRERRMEEEDRKERMNKQEERNKTSILAIESIAANKKH